MAVEVRGVAMVAVASGWLVVSAVGQADEVRIELLPVNVEASQVADSSEEVVRLVSSSASKTDTPLVVTAQSVSTITRKQLDDQAAQTVGESLRYTAGVLSDRDTNRRYDSVFLRGFGAFGTATNYVSFLDGLKLPRGQAFAQSAIDPYLLDHVDVLKGPSALLYGQVSPGGLVNQVSRQPSAVAAHEVLLEMGSDGREQMGISSRGAFNESRSLQYGVSVIGRHADSRYDNVEEERYAVAPSITWQPDADTYLTLSGYYQKDPEGGYFNSVYPTFLAPSVYRDALGRSLNIGDPDYDAFSREQQGIGYQFEHRTSDMLTLRSRARYSSVDVDFQSLQMLAPLSSSGVIARQALQSIEEVHGLSLDNQAQFDFATAAVDHRLLLGIDYQDVDSYWQYNWALAPSLDLNNPQYGVAIGSLTTLIDSQQTLRQTGLYLQDQMSFGGFRALLGVRYDWTKQDTENRLTQTQSNQSSEASSYRTGLLYAFASGISPYVSYSTSFEPNVGVDTNGSPFLPSKARQYEVGVKYQPPGEQMLYTLSLFDIEQRDALVPDQVGFNTQEGRIRSRGIELEARGDLTSNIELITALTVLDVAVVDAAMTANEGNRPQAVPRYFASTWVNYHFNRGLLDGLALGTGVRTVGSSYADNANEIKASGYTLLDLGVRYDFGKSLLQLPALEGHVNLNNALDKTYYSSCSSNFYCQYGNGRQVIAGLRYRW
ncbi:iron complex outermembrane recepter protein [Pseudomonas flavescens]|uniref:Iron complex outermembrane recepter protein n=1 Tax=Phytopseudomonas flavescens TaxID=29435 RepID=A0A1G8P5X5_9GAMM|nr:TonB-dependent siderophore receptor [Pseudomonas flavescens]SDI87894.1 iron complex outermembrane recepter protein [Pseudomonas flavescens]